MKRKSEDGSLIFPRPDRPDIVDLVRVIARALEVPSIDTRPAADSISQWIGQPEHIVFLLLDGLGVNIVQRLPADSFLTSRLKGELLSVVPSTTASALAALGTTVYPDQHAVPGWFKFLPDFEITTTILPFIERYTEIPLQERGITGPDVFTQPSWMPRVPGDTLVLQPEQYYDGVFAQFMRGDTPGRGYETMRQAMDSVVEHVSQARSKSFALLYLPQLDTISHVVGPMHEEVLAMALTLDAELSGLAALLEGKARLIISADHGQITVPHDNQIEFFNGDPLLEVLEVPPTGEGRLPLFHVQDQNREAFETMFQRSLCADEHRRSPRDIALWTGPHELRIKIPLRPILRNPSRGSHAGLSSPNHTASIQPHRTPWRAFTRRDDGALNRGLNSATEKPIPAGI